MLEKSIFHTNLNRKFKKWPLNFQNFNRKTHLEPLKCQSCQTVCSCLDRSKLLTSYSENHKKKNKISLDKILQMTSNQDKKFPKNQFHLNGALSFISNSDFDDCNKKSNSSWYRHHDLSQHFEIQRTCTIPIFVYIFSSMIRSRTHE